jgi:hypothetical protein
LLGLGLLKHYSIVIIEIYFGRKRETKNA